MEDMGATDLSGLWRAAPAEGDLHQRFAEPGFDDSAWAEVGVPGPWRSTEALSGADGPVLYRRRLDPCPPGAPGRRSSSCSTASSTTATCGSTGAIWGRRRATSHRSASK